ncbi:MAG: tRNA pseudouridine(55) synthase TruB [Myxococcales bacterium]|jgi:tRNA pseudouridine55 synthase|nr:tRNA pseudouridine(55) synthase TruB [Deltaproteobacteria bacterium]MBW2189678.1 tRNA pseudouridine(55) synthase TruB [Deltaproteobacteria bacterium]NOQ85093.1 tRNA pseudouridine(55) synthase TruB [Myxococcales bacterium]
MNGLLIVDKPAGCTSHDVVRRVRKALGQRSVGHAGTLDPLATGVLVVAVGEGTKLVSHLQSDDKRYEVTIALGAETDSLDADGEVTDTAKVPPLDSAMVERALLPFIGRNLQEAPKLSAIKLGGTPLHRRVRRGEDVEAPVREVELYEAKVDEVSQEALRLRLHCGKGFYVRSLARDVARALGTLGHVKALRRTASGAFSIDASLYGDQMTADAIGERLIPLSKACGALWRVDLIDEGVSHARHGRPIGPDVIVGEAWRDASPDEALALFAPDGEPVALGRRVDDGIRVVRGFTTAAPDVVSP